MSCSSPLNVCGAKHRSPDLKLLTVCSCMMMGSVPKWRHSCLNEKFCGWSSAQICTAGFSEHCLFLGCLKLLFAFDLLFSFPGEAWCVYLVDVQYSIWSRFVPWVKMMLVHVHMNCIVLAQFSETTNVCCRVVN